MPALGHAHETPAHPDREGGEGPLGIASHFSPDISTPQIVAGAIRQAARARGAHGDQLNYLKSLRAALVDRMNEINSQLVQIDRVIKAASERPADSARRRSRRDFDVVRERVVEWMAERHQQKFSAADVVRQFPELDGVPVCILLKPLVEAGAVQKDSSQGNRRTKYFVGEK